MAYTTDDLVAAVKRRGQLPAANGQLSDADILELATDQLDGVLMPLLRSIREEYLVRIEVIPIVSGQRTYRIPSRASAGAIRSIWVRYDSGDEVPCPAIAAEDRAAFRELQGRWDAPFGTTLEGNDIWVSPTPQPRHATMSLVVRYWQRVGRLVPTSACDQVLTWSSGPREYTASTYVVSGDADIIGGAPPFRTRALGADVTLGPPATLAADPDEDLEAGDYVCVADTTCVPQIPVEARRPLETATLAATMEALGYEREQGAAMQMLAAQLAAVRTMMEPRKEGGARAIHNPRSTLRRGRMRRWG